MRRVIASRESELALAQARIVMESVARPGLEMEILTIKTAGDRILDRPLDKIGGKGLFVGELAQALRSGKADLAVHSCKDLPTDLPEDLPVAAFSRREDPRDALVLPLGEEKLDLSRPIGCGSLRRQAQLRLLYPEAQFMGIRGNVLTRLGKLDRGEYGALVLAAAGMKRLGLEGRIHRYFSVDEMLPAAGQGVLAVQCRRGENTEYLDPVRDRTGEACALAERAFVRALGGDCSSPVAAYAELKRDEVYLRGLFVDETGRLHRGEARGPWNRAGELAEKLVEKLKEETRCLEK